MPSSLNCPTCGAPASSGDATHCDYCGSTLTTVACPSCFGTMFVGMDFCPSCGAKATRELDATGAMLPCPGCKGEMRALSVGTTAMHECQACASLWLDAAAFTELCVNRENRGAVTAFVGVTSTTSTGRSVNGAVRYVPCPVCAKVMNRQNFGRRSGVIIDVCKGHGVWFERSELRAALAFIDSGGFERARQAETQRQTEEQAKLLQTFQRSASLGERMEIVSHVDRAGSSHESLLTAVLRTMFS